MIVRDRPDLLAELDYDKLRGMEHDELTCF
jgi:hypothetical protein